MNRDVDQIGPPEKLSAGHDVSQFDCVIGIAEAARMIGAKR